MPRWVLVACASVAVALAACGSPPSKEMDQAQGGIDAARAAGADRYAVTEYTAATSALQRARDAVAQRDYRLALNEALDSREHAQNAAREAADSKAQLRADVEREMAEIAVLLAQANTRLTGAARARVPAGTIEAQRRALADVEERVQKAGAATGSGDYLSAKAALQGSKEQITKVVAALARPTAQSARRPR